MSLRASIFVFPCHRDCQSCCHSHNFGIVSLRFRIEARHEPLIGNVGVFGPIRKIDRGVVDAPQRAQRTVALSTLARAL